jgi:hypothetical protein
MDSWSDHSSVAASGTTRRPTIERLRPALDAIHAALAAPAVSLDKLRRVVVRYGALAREQALQLEEMLATLRRSTRDVIDALPSSRQAEVLAFVQWWAVHGYHRAD